MMNSRTNFRLQLQREQSIQEQQKMSTYNSNNVEMTDDDSMSSPTRGTSSPMAIKVSANSGGNNSRHVPKTLPVIISQPIRFAGNRLVHLPPQIIHVQQQTQNLDDMGRKNMTLSSSLPPGFVQSPLAKTPKLNENRVGTPQQSFFPQQVLSGSKQSSAELSPAGYTDSPRSASFASAQSELDDVIIDEILSMEEEQQRRKQHEHSSSSRHHNSPDKLTNSLSYADDLEGLLTAGRLTNDSNSSSSFQRQVSNSAPSTTVDIEGLVRDELIREQELMRDRRKKDVHNMIERRRRYNINDRIKELGSLLPKSCTEEMKLNKGTILQASVDYILTLRKDQERLMHVQQKQHTLEMENRRMVQRIQDLESRLKATGAEVPPPPMPSDDCKPSAALGHFIKTEPVDEDDTTTTTTTNYSSSYGATTQNPPPTSASSNLNLPTDYSPALSGHSYAAISSTPSDGQQVTYYATTPYDTNGLLNLNNGNLILMENGGQIFASHTTNSGIMLPRNNNATTTTNSNNQVHELIMELGGAGDHVTSPGLISSSDPMMSDTRLMNSQVSSPDIHWDAATFSPDNEHMDFVAT